MFRFDKQENGEYIIRHSDNVVYSKDFGVLSRAHDAVYNWWPPDDLGKRGFWSSWMLQAISDKLNELNKPIEDEMNAFFEQWEKDHKDDKFDELSESA